MSLINPVSGCGAVGAAVASGVYATFSMRVMPRLAAMREFDGIAAMQQFNRDAVQPPFMVVFFGSAVASVWTIVDMFSKEHRTTADWLCAAGGALYLAGFVLTVVYNVPRNRALDAVSAGDPNAGRVWSTYLSEWSAANSVRAVLSGAGALALAAGTALPLLTAVGRKG